MVRTGEVAIAASQVRDARFPESDARHRGSLLDGRSAGALEPTPARGAAGRSPAPPSPIEATDPAAVALASRLRLGPLVLLGAARPRRLRARRAGQRPRGRLARRGPLRRRRARLRRAAARRRADRAARACPPAPGRSGPAASPSTPDGGARAAVVFAAPGADGPARAVAAAPRAAAAFADPERRSSRPMAEPTPGARARARSAARLARGRRRCGPLDPAPTRRHARSARRARPTTTRRPVAAAVERIARRGAGEGGAGSRGRGRARRGARPGAALRRAARALPVLLLLLRRHARGGLHRREPRAADPPPRGGRRDRRRWPARPGAAPTPPWTITSASRCCTAPRSARSTRSSCAGSSARCGRTRSGCEADAEPGGRAGREHPAPRDADPGPARRLALGDRAGGPTAPDPRGRRASRATRRWR